MVFKNVMLCRIRISIPGALVDAVLRPSISSYNSLANTPTMAEPIGRASGIFRLSAFAFTSSASLHQAVQSFQSNDKTVRALTKELEDLEAVIQPLRRAISTNETDLEPLKLPLYRCGRACEEFEAMITNPKARSDGRKPISRDWTQLKYMGDDLHGFKKILAGYKSTIFIALADINL